jgi:hypothetical protein
MPSRKARARPQAAGGNGRKQAETLCAALHCRYRRLAKSRNLYRR